MLRKVILAACFVMMACASSPVLADMTGTFADSYGSTGGGEFIFTPSGDFNGLTLAPFITFCVETNEYIDTSHVFTVVGMDEFAEHGGAGGGSPDPLDEKTAWLYQSFRDGTLAAYNYDYNPGSGRVASADALQRVMWGIEGELGVGWTPDAGLEAAFYGAATSNATGLGLGNVRVLNIAWPNGDFAQSQLVLVPAPGAAFLGALGLGMAGWFRRRLS